MMRPTKADAQRGSAHSARGNYDRAKVRRPTSDKRPGLKGGKGEWGPEPLLQFIPRAQLMEKIERIAVLNSDDLSRTSKEIDVSAADTERWRNGWDAKFSHSSIMALGFERGFTGTLDGAP